MREVISLLFLLCNKDTPQNSLIIIKSLKVFDLARKGDRNYQNKQSEKSLKVRALRFLLIFGLDWL